MKFLERYPGGFLERCGRWSGLYNPMLPTHWIVARWVVVIVSLFFYGGLIWAVLHAI